jgi:hypothetical protein
MLVMGINGIRNKFSTLKITSVVDLFVTYFCLISNVPKVLCLVNEQSIWRRSYITRAAVPVLLCTFMASTGAVLPWPWPLQTTSSESAGSRFSKSRHIDLWNVVMFIMKFISRQKCAPKNISIETRSVKLCPKPLICNERVNSSRHLTCTHCDCLNSHVHLDHKNFSPHGAKVPNGPGPPRCRGFMITLGHTTLGRTPLDVWSSRRRDLYLTAHNTHNRHTSMPPAGFETAIPASERPQTAQPSGSAITRHIWTKSIRTSYNLIWTNF